MAAKQLLIEALSRFKCKSISRANVGSSDPTYYPPRRLGEVFHGTNVAEILRQIPDSHIREDERGLFTSLIREKAMKIFCILCLIDQENLIAQFLYRRLHDSRLPFKDTDIDFISEKNGEESRDQFLVKQWKFIPVIFRKTELHQAVANPAILPFEEDRFKASGSFGDVYKVKIHPECHDFIGDTSKVRQPQDILAMLTARKAGSVARKELKVMRGITSNEELLMERKTLELIRKIYHPNIIELLYSYESQDTHNFIFPYASSDLKAFLKGPIDLSSDVIYHGMYGVASAVAHIHNFTYRDGMATLDLIGYHHDLHPGNILRLGSRFVVSDFGLSKLKSPTQTSKDILRGGIDVYQPPEAVNEADFRKGEVGRAFDVWSLGCMLAEIATVIEGFQIDDFEMARREVWNRKNETNIDYTFHLHGQIRTGVHEWLQKLEGGGVRPPKDPQTPALVQLVRETLQPNWRVRMKMQTVVERLAVIAFSAKVSEVERFSQQMFPDLNNPTDIFVWLEGKRFAVATEKYQDLLRDSSDSFQRGIDKVLQTIVSIQDWLQLICQRKQIISATSDLVLQSEEIQGLCYCIDELVGELPEYLRKDLDEIFSRNVSSLGDVEILRAIKEASVPARYRQVGSRAAMKLMACSVSDAIGGSYQMELTDPGVIDIDPSSWKISTSEDPMQDRVGAMRSMGTYNGDAIPRRALIEWRYYDIRWAAAPGQSHLAGLNRIAQFFNAKRTPRGVDFPMLVLNCLRFFHEPANNRFGFIYDVDLSSMSPLSTFPSHYTLYEYVRDTSTLSYPDPRKCAPRPALGDKFLLAKDLATTLHALHEVGWLHKSISSHNILMFCKDSLIAYKHLSSAVLAGFAHSRLEESHHSFGNQAIPFNLYEHPGYTFLAASKAEEVAPTFRRIHEYYSFGLILLELGLWLTAFALYQPFRKEMVSKLETSIMQKEVKILEAFRQKLLDTYVPMLREKMGQHYMEAVRFCLTAENLLESPEDDYDTRKRCGKEFKTNVVDKLSLCMA